MKTTNKWLPFAFRVDHQTLTLSCQ